MDILLLTLLFSAVSAVLYRLGGIGKPFNTKVRDFGAPIVALIQLHIMGIHLPILYQIISFFAMFGALTTYCKIGKQTDVYWYNWLLTGLLYSVSCILVPVYTHQWLAFMFRSIFLITATCLWSIFINNDTLEESGRGFWYNLSLLFYLV